MKNPFTPQKSNILNRSSCLTVKRRPQAHHLNTISAHMNLPSSSQNLPSQPGKHSHSKSLMRSWQGASFMQGSGRQSSVQRNKQHAGLSQSSEFFRSKVEIVSFAQKSWNLRFVSLQGLFCYRYLTFVALKPNSFYGFYFMHRQITGKY